MSQIPFGNTVRLRAAFRDADTQALVDPLVVKIRLRPRANQQDTTEFVYGTDAELVRESLGKFKLLWVPPTPGGWLFEWESDTPKSRDGGSFIMTRSQFS